MNKVINLKQKIGPRKFYDACRQLIFKGYNKTHNIKTSKGVANFLNSQNHE